MSRQLIRVHLVLVSIQPVFAGALFGLVLCLAQLMAIIWVFELTQEKYYLDSVGSKSILIGYVLVACYKYSTHKNNLYIKPIPLLLTEVLEALNNFFFGSHLLISKDMDINAYYFQKFYENTKRSKTKNGSLLLRGQKVTVSHTGKDRKREYLPQKMAEKVALSTVLHVGSVTYYYGSI